MLETLKEWDKELFIFLNNLGAEQYDSFWIFITQIESWTALFVFLCFVVFYYYRGKKGILVAAATVVAFLITLFLTEGTKDLVSRVRPNNVEGFSNMIRVLQHPTSYSFFSGHASTSMAMSLFLVLSLRKFNRWIYLLWLWPLLFISSRIYVGVHYPSDILVGVLVGMIMGCLCFQLSSRLLQKL